MSRNSLPSTIATVGIDIGKNTFHLVGLDKRGAIVLQQKTSRGQLERRLANVPCCLIGMEACSGAHHIGRQLQAIGHDVRDPCAIREAVPQGPQERLSRRRGDRGSGEATNDVFPAYQDARADGPPSSAPRALAPRRPAYRVDQSDPW